MASQPQPQPQPKADPAAAGFAQPDFAYAAANDSVGLQVSLAIFADRPHLRDILREDALAAGFRIGDLGEVSMMLAGEVRPLGEVVLVDCPQPSGADLAALVRLDMRAARAGAQLVVSTSVAALDDVFGCLDQSAPQILVDPTRAERVVALGRVLAKLPRLRVCELSQSDRLVLLRLTEQVSQIAGRLERIEGPAAPLCARGATGAGRADQRVPVRIAGGGLCRGERRAR